MIGASLYSYRHNFDGKKGSGKRPYKSAFRCKLIDLLRPGYMLISRHEVDLFVGIAQWLMRKGYPVGRYGVLLSLNGDHKHLLSYFSDALFSVDPFLPQSLYINEGGFLLYEWRKQFDLFGETDITGLKYYRNRQSTPIRQFMSLSDVENVLFGKADDYNFDCSKLLHQYNRSHELANIIFSKRMRVFPDKLQFVIQYGYEEDNKPGGSSWEIFISSEPGENYIDFCLRLYHHYKYILMGDPDVMVPAEENRPHSPYYVLKSRIEPSEYNDGIRKLSLKHLYE